MGMMERHAICPLADALFWVLLHWLHLGIWGGVGGNLKPTPSSATFEEGGHPFSCGLEQPEVCEVGMGSWRDCHRLHP